MKCAFVGATPFYAKNGVATYLRRLSSCYDYFKLHDCELIGVFCGDGVYSAATDFTDNASKDLTSNKQLSFRGVLTRQQKDWIKSVLSNSSIGSKIALYFSHIRYAKRAIRYLSKHIEQADVFVFNDPFTLNEYINNYSTSKCKTCIVTHDNGEFGKMLKESYPKLSSDYIDQLLSKCLSYVDCIIEVGKNSHIRFCELYPHLAYKAVHIKTGIPSVEIERHYKSDGMIKLINVGTLCSRKNQANLIRAIASSVNKQHFRLTLVGGGPDFDLCQDLVSRYDLSTSITLTGPTSEVPRYLSDSDVYISVSLDEGLPIAMIEAMSCGLPLITSRAGSCPDLIEKNGYIFEGFEVESICTALDWLYANRNDLREMGNNSTLLYESNYTLSSMCNSYIELFNKLVEL